jgi:phosphate starvation-inducible membrane PsiE
LKKDGYQLCNIGVYFLVDEITSKEAIQSVWPVFFFLKNSKKGKIMFDFIFIYFLLFYFISLILLRRKKYC